MKFERSIKLEVFASKDETRPHLNHVYLDTIDNVMVATDGHRMIVTPVSDTESDHNGPVTAESLAAARKLATRNGEPSIHANGALALDNGTSFARPSTEPFPQWRQVMPKPGKQDQTVGVNARFLAGVFQALGDRIVAMTVAGPLDPIVFKVPTGTSETIMLVMPARL
jgi:DNA polymerase III sliding clamp (beta) subunit (PCNA family)